MSLLPARAARRAPLQLLRTAARAMPHVAQPGITMSQARTERLVVDTFAKLRRYSSRLETTPDECAKPDISCPYAPGESLQVSFRPDFTDSQEVAPLKLRIEHAFTPFTGSQVLLVRLCADAHVTPARSSLPTQFILKVFDRRFNEVTDSPWTPQRDEQVRTLLDEIAAGRRPCPPASSLGGTGYVAEDNLTVEWQYSRSWRASGSWVDELATWEILERMYNREVETYKRLRPIQGVSIPRFYGTVTFPIPGLRASLRSKSWPPTWTYNPDVVRGIVLEYVDGTNVDTLKRGVDLTEAQIDQLLQETSRISEEIHRLGVVHNDHRTANVIVRKSDGRPVIIDFGLALFKEEEYGDEESYREATVRRRETGQVALAFIRGGLRDKL